MRRAGGGLEFSLTGQRERTSENLEEALPLTAFEKKVEKFIYHLKRGGWRWNSSIPDPSLESRPGKKEEDEARRDRSFPCFCS